MAGCSCIKGNFDFHINAVSLDTIIYTDLSDWMTDAEYVIPQYYNIEVTPPNGYPARTVQVSALNSSRLSIDDLGFGGCCIPDGIYKIQAWGCYDGSTGSEGENRYTKHVSITPQAQCQVDNIIATNDDFSIGIEMQSRLIQIESVSSLQKPKEASKLFKILKSELKKYNCDFCKC